MAWIKWVVGLERRSEVLAVATATAREPEYVAALCMIAWAWADAEGHDGFISGATLTMLDLVVGGKCPGFADALAKTDWLQNGDSGLRFAKWDRHNSPSAKDRAIRQQRMATRRETEGVRKGYTKGTERAPEERREDKSKEYKDLPATPVKEKVVRSEKQVERDGLWDAVVAEWKLPVGTPTQRSRIGKLVTELRGAGAIPSEIAVRRKRVVDAWGPEKATPESVVRHWSEFDGTSPSKSRVGRIEAPPGKYDGVMAKATVTGTSKRGRAAGEPELAFPATGQEPSDRGG